MPQNFHREANDQTAQAEGLGTRHGEHSISQENDTSHAQADTSQRSIAVPAENSDTDHTAHSYSVGASISRGYFVPQNNFRGQDMSHVQTDTPGMQSTFEPAENSD